MIEPSQDLSIDEEAAMDLVRVHAALDQLEGRLLLELAELGRP
jgi:hypothetical protein